MALDVSSPLFKSRSVTGEIIFLCASVSSLSPQP